MADKDRQDQPTPIDEEQLDQAAGAGGLTKTTDTSTTSTGTPRTPTSGDFVKDVYNDLLGRDTSSSQTVSPTTTTVKP